MTSLPPCSLSTVVEEIASVPSSPSRRSTVALLGLLLIIAQSLLILATAFITGLRAHILLPTVFPTRLFILSTQHSLPVASRLRRPLISTPPRNTHALYPTIEQFRNLRILSVHTFNTHNNRLGLQASERASARWEGGDQTVRRGNGRRDAWKPSPQTNKHRH